MKALALILMCLSNGAMAACRQALALGLDISGSVDAAEHALQRQGLADALRSEAVQQILFIPGAAPIRVTVYEWSGPTDQSVIVPWTDLNGPEDLAQVARALRLTPRRSDTITTALGPAMQFGFDLLMQHPDCWKRTLDLSGDGKANTGPPPETIALPASGGDITVNALVIGAPERPGGNWGAGLQELSAYFVANVLRGPQPFVEVAFGFDDYARAMERKLLRELESLAAVSLP